MMDITLCNVDTSARWGSVRPGDLVVWFNVTDPVAGCLDLVLSVINDESLVEVTFMMLACSYPSFRKFNTLCYCQDMPMSQYRCGVLARAT